MNSKDKNTKNLGYSEEHIKTWKDAWIQEVLQKIAKKHQETGIWEPNIPMPTPEPIAFSKAISLYDIPFDNTPLLRYMKGKHFEDLILNKKLHMCSPQRFTQDCNEGLLHKDIANYIDSALENVYSHIIKNFPYYKNMLFSGIQLSGNKFRDLKIMKNRWRDIYRHNRQRFYISCWTNNDVDQDNMWNAYIPDEKDKKNAVAIKTSVKNLKNALIKSPKQNYGLYALTKIKYVDINNLPEISKDELQSIVTGVWATNCFLLTRKLKQFEDDREIRLMTDNLMTYTTTWYKNGVNTLLGEDKFDYNAQPEFLDLFSSINPNILIEKIILSPKASETRINEIEKLLKENNLEHIPIEYSQINRKIEDA